MTATRASAQPCGFGQPSGFNSKPPSPPASLSTTPLPALLSASLPAWCYWAPVPAGLLPAGLVASPLPSFASCLSPHLKSARASAGSHGFLLPLDRLALDPPDRPLPTVLPARSCYSVHLLRGHSVIATLQTSSPCERCGPLSACLYHTDGPRWLPRDPSPTCLNHARVYTCTCTVVRAGRPLRLEPLAQGGKGRAVIQQVAAPLHCGVCTHTHCETQGVQLGLLRASALPRAEPALGKKRRRRNFGLRCKCEFISHSQLRASPHTELGTAHYEW